MKLLTTFQRLSTVSVFLLCVGGVPGLAQSQALYDDGYYGYNDYGYGYDDGYNDYGYGYDDGVLTDSELRRRIQSNLAMSPFVDGEDVQISVDNRVATLSGTVEDRSAMIDAVELAYDAGARKVRNKLSQSGRDDRPWADMGDSELKEEIRDELDSSPFVNAEQISVSVRNGVATLSGGVENKGEIADAVENAYEAGAKRVKSRLWVDPDL
jgi:osmotically-inducible protein OsmY